LTSKRSSKGSLHNNSEMMNPKLNKDLAPIAASAAEIA